MENFIPLAAEIQPDVSPDILQEEYEEAVDFDKVAVGQKHIFFNRFARVEYLLLSQITAVYRQIGGINPNQCCNMSFDVFTLVVEYGGAKAECRLPYEEQLPEILRYLQKKLPNIAITAE